MKKIGKDKKLLKLLCSGYIFDLPLSFPLSVQAKHQYPTCGF